MGVTQFFRGSWLVLARADPLTLMVIVSLCRRDDLSNQILSDLDRDHDCNYERDYAHDRSDHLSMVITMMIIKR